MGRMFITFDNLNDYLDNQYNGYCDEQRFLNDFYNIGFTKKSHEIFDLNIERYPQIDFSYDDFERLNKNKLYNNYKMFLNYNEPLDNVLFYIAENYYEIFLDFKEEFINEFNIIKSTFIKTPDFEDLINKIDSKIIYFERMIERISFSREENKLTEKDLSKSLRDISGDRNSNKLFEDLEYDIFEFENMNLKYFENDKIRTIDYFSKAILKLRNIRDKLTLNDNVYNSYNYESNYIENVNFEMSAPKMAAAQFDSSKEDYNINQILNFEELRLKISDELGLEINSEIYINFLAFMRIKEHFKDIDNLRNSLGTVLKK